VGQYRSAVSGGEGEHLLEREVTTLSIESRKQLLEKVGITLTITEQQGLAMKDPPNADWGEHQFISTTTA
jgi:hypothetical protein